jgi:hypothetical protein
MAAAPGWYPDPYGQPGILRRFDGAQWTADTAKSTGTGRSHRNPGPAPADYGWMPSHWDGPPHWNTVIAAAPTGRWKLRAVVAVVALVAAVVVFWAAAAAGVLW